jgi:hypothetical protein
MGVSRVLSILAATSHRKFAHVSGILSDYIASMGGTPMLRMSCDRAFTTAGLLRITFAASSRMVQTTAIFAAKGIQQCFQPRFFSP